MTDTQLVDTIFQIMGAFRNAIQPSTYLINTVPVLKKSPKFMRTRQTWLDRELAWQRPFMHGLLHQTEMQMQRRSPQIKVSSAF